MTTRSEAPAQSRLLLVEDDGRLGPIIRDVVSMDWSVELVDSLRAARARLDAGMFAVAIVDRGLPDGDGADLVAWMRARGIATPVLMLTALGRLDDKVEGLDAGANDYLVKPFEFEELRARLRALTRDYSGRGRGIDIGSWTFYPENSTIESPYTGRILLTRKESALLHVLASMPDTALTRRQLLDAVFDHGEQEGTVDTYVHYLRRKTDKDLIETVRGIGYRLGTPA